MTSNMRWLTVVFRHSSINYPSISFLAPTKPPRRDGPFLSHLLARQDVAGQLDLSKVSFADGLQQAVVADVRLFVRDGRAAARRQTVAARRFGGRRRRIGEAVRSLYLWETQTVIVKHLAHCDSSGYPGRQRGATGKRTRTSSVYDTADDSTHNIIITMFVV